MLDLSEVSGLPLKFNSQNNSLVFGDELPKIKPNKRLQEEMKKVLQDPTAPMPSEFYYMYRDIHRKEDEDIIRRKKLRYDITMIPGFLIGKEFNKTVGHYHSLVPKTKLSYPEIYEVLTGCAHYLLQKSLPPYNQIEEVMLIEALPGDKVIIPPNFGHITINPKNETLVMANWMADNLSSIYEPYNRFRGGCYYEIISDNGYQIIPNPNYSSLPELKWRKASCIEIFGINKNLPMYQSFLQNPDKFDFLVRPQDFGEEFAKIIL